MTDFPLIASLAVFVLFTTLAFRYQNPLILSLICGFMGALLTGGLLHVGAYNAPATTMSLLALGALLAPVFALECTTHSSFAESNTVLLSRDGFAGMTLTSAMPLAHSAPAHACAA